MSTRLQLVLNKSLKESAENKFSEYGLNISEGVRFLLTSFVNGKTSIKFGEGVEEVNLSKAAEQRYQKIMKDIEAGKNLTVYDPSRPMSEQV